MRPGDGSRARPRRANGETVSKSADQLDTAANLDPPIKGLRREAVTFSRPVNIGIVQDLDPERPLTARDWCRMRVRPCWSSWLIGLACPGERSDALASTRDRRSAPDSGWVLREVAVMLADGGGVTDMVGFHGQERLFAAPP